MNKRDNKGKVKILCKKHGEFWQKPYLHINGSGCPVCNNIKENVFFKHFTNIFKDVKIECQKRFDWLGKQSLDFYLPDYNIGIEYQGIQHFQKNKLFGGEKYFIEQQERDIRKKQLCEENNIKLIYFTFDKNKKEFLGEKVYNIVLDLKEILI